MDKIYRKTPLYRFLQLCNEDEKYKTVLDCGAGGEGPHLGANQYEQMDDEPVIHSYYEYDEADVMFDDMIFITKERRVIERIYEGKRIKQGFIDYIYRK